MQEGWGQIGWEWQTGGQFQLSYRQDSRFNGSLGSGLLIGSEAQWVLPADLTVGLRLGLLQDDAARSGGVVYRAVEGSFVGTSLGYQLAAVPWGAHGQLRWGLRLAGQAFLERYTATDLAFLNFSVGPEVWTAWRPWQGGQLIGLAVPVAYFFDSNLTWHLSLGLKISLGVEG